MTVTRTKACAVQNTPMSLTARDTLWSWSSGQLAAASLICSLEDMMSQMSRALDLDDVKLNVEYLVGIVYIEFLWQIEYTCC